MNKRDVMLNTEAHRAAFNDFAAAFQRIEQREHWSAHDIVGYFLEAAFRAIRGRLVAGEVFDQNEAEYMRIVKRCQDPQVTMGAFATMLGATTLALEAAPIDFLGPIYTAFAANTYAGQFFTPYSVSRAMAEMVLFDAASLLRDKPCIMLHEPACGVGGMMLAANEVLQSHSIDIARQAHWVAVDIDARAMQGAYIQMSLTGASATIIHGNSITLEQWMAAATPMAIMFPKRASATIPTPTPKLPAPTSDKRGQFSFAF